MPIKVLLFDDQFDFDLRPNTYWSELPSERSVLGEIPGTVRRAVGEGALRGERLAPEEVELIFEKELSDQDRESWGRLHPHRMGGEYLPATEEDEVEIARIELASTTADVIQVRARHADGTIAYRIVDEYYDEGSRYDVAPASCAQPLTLGELIDVIDTARRVDEGWRFGDDRYDIGLVDSAREFIYEGPGDAEGLRDFVRVSSPFYPELEPYFQLRAEAWVEQRLADPGADEQVCGDEG
jgi:hypothetical protein